MLDLKTVQAIVPPVIMLAMDQPEMYRIDCAFDTDHMGDERIVLSIFYLKGAPTINVRRLLDAVNEAMTILSKKGDQRFIYVQHVVEDGELAQDRFVRTVKPSRKTAI